METLHWLDAPAGFGYQERMAGAYGFQLQAGTLSGRTGGVSPSGALLSLVSFRLFDVVASFSSLSIASGFT